MIMILTPQDIHASVRIANHHPVTPRNLWERSIPDPQLICIIEGVFEYSEDGASPVTLQPGEILWIEPNVQHRFCMDSRQVEGWIAGMHFEFSPAGRWAAGDYRLPVQPERVTRPNDPHYLQERFVRMAAVYESYQPFRKELVDSIANEILLTLMAHWRETSRVARAGRPSPRMEAILSYIRANLAQPISRCSLAATFNLSAGYINQLFQVELGMPPSAVINRERVARAYKLLDRDGLSVGEAASAVGFEDPFYFSRVFKQIYTIPPSQVASKKQPAQTGQTSIHSPDPRPE
jgi:AraC-like DNA-binding protein